MHLPSSHASGLFRKNGKNVVQAPLLVEFKNATICTVQLVQLLYAHDV